MNKLIGVLLLAAATCATAAAQQEKNQTNSEAKPQARETGVSQAEQALPFRPSFKFVPPNPQTWTTKDRAQVGRPQVFVILPPQWVFKDGALYLDIFGNGALVPVPGGGASGCFGSNLRERIEKLRTTIEGFPPRPQATAPR